MSSMPAAVREPTFREKLVQEFSRDELLNLVKKQDMELYNQVRRIERVFENKLRHLNWTDGSPIEGRPVTAEELALLIDEPFTPDRELTRIGVSIEQQHQLHVAKDPVLWAKNFLNEKPRVYQIIMLRDPSTRKVLRAGRRLGKTFTMALMLLHYSYTHNDGKCLVIAPMKSQVELIYKEVERMVKRTVVEESITRMVTSPQFVIEFSNGSTVRMFTSGMKSAGKSDVARGQEAHIIILDELDYMGEEDLVALMAMLQTTQEGQIDKIMVGASTPTGQHGKFWEWCHAPHWREFYYPSYCNPFFTQEVEDEMRLEYNEMDYRHEIEADWGEDTEGVYPRKFIDMAFKKHSIEWQYQAVREPTQDSVYLFGVDWDKFGAGVNIVILEMCGSNHPIEEFRNKLRIRHREEVSKGDYTLLSAVDRIIELNSIFDPKWIYVDRGYGEAQLELLKKYGVDHPTSGLNKKVVGHTFSDSIEMPDPQTKIMGLKEIKPFMVNNLRQLLEQELIIFPEHDEDLYKQLISYVVRSVSVYGRQTFEMSGNVPDHAHDALILACLAFIIKYSDMMKLRLATKSYTISNEPFLATFNVDNDQDEAMAEELWDSPGSAPVKINRPMTVQKVGRSRPIRRSSF